MAPGEAEAECALLQRNGVVDAVLSEDVDTIMFGCTKTLRNWSADGKGSKPPTHVTVYDTQHQDIIDTGLDREGMVLVALMSGGDYCPEGIPGCGVKIACEAAKAGFGKSLCRLKTTDKDGIKAWRKNLTQELHTNDSGYFRTKHKSLVIPESFPDMEVVRLYTHPAISPLADIETIRQKVLLQSKVELEELREFTRETFDWDYRGGALKFIKVMSHAMLVQNLRDTSLDTEHLVQKIGSQRLHFNTDNTAELRVTYVPEEVVPIDLSQEVEETVSYAREGLALEGAEELDSSNEGEATSTLATATAVKEFDASKPDAVWMLESVARRGAPAAFQAFEEAELLKAYRKASPKKAAAKKTAKSKSDMPYGAIESHLKTTKRLDSTVAADIAKKLPDTPRSPSKQRISKTSSSKLLSPASSPAKRLHHPPRSPRQERAATGSVKAPTAASSKTAASYFAKDDAIIILSSSPAAAEAPPSPASPPESPTRHTGPVPRANAALPGTVQSILSESPRSSTMSSSSSRSQLPPPKMGRLPAKKLTQTSMDLFRTAKKAESPIKAVQVIDDSIFDSDSDDEVLPPLPSGENQQGSEDLLGKTKLLLVPDNKTGTLKEVEVDERDRERLEKALGKSRVTRYSDISVVDLTGD